MINKGKKNVSKRILYTAIIIYVGYILCQQHVYLKAYKAEENSYLKEIDKDKKVAQQYQKQKELYRTDSYIEEIARTKLGMVYPGEKIFIDTSK